MQFLHVCKKKKEIKRESASVSLLLGVFVQENYVFVYFSDEMGENIVSTVKLQKWRACLGIFPAKPYPMFRDIFEKKVTYPFQRHTPVHHIRRVPPPPPPPPGGFTLLIPRVLYFCISKGRVPLLFRSYYL